MAIFQPEKLPCNLEQVRYEIEESLQDYERVSSIIKVIGTMLTIEEVKSFFSTEDVNFQLDSLAENIFKIEVHLNNLKAQIAYLIDPTIND